MLIRAQIKATFFLLIMSVMFLHNAVPHNHAHTGESTKNTTHHHSHADGHHHHHDHSDDRGTPSEDETGSFLSSLFDGHTHTFHSHEYTPAVKSSPNVTIKKALPVGVFTETYQSLLPEKNYNLHRHGLFEVSFYDNPLLLHSSLRAPPSLG